MDELTANVSFDRFADVPDFYGSGAAEYRLAMVKERADFLDLFVGARHVDAVTYAETPDLMVKMLTEYDIGSLDVLFGNAEEYADQVIAVVDDPTPEVLNHCLETIEDYIETVEAHGHTQSETAVMAQMYEAFLYGFWAPFANQYAEALSSPSRTLDNVLRHLYIEGKSDAGKVKLTEYVLRFISDNTVVSGVDADDVGVDEIRGVREWDTCFPYAIIDAEKRKIQSWSPIRNYWGDWTPTNVDQPCLIFTTNDALPRSEFRNRMKILSMDVSFPSNPEDTPDYEMPKTASRPCWNGRIRSSVASLVGCSPNGRETRGTGLSKTSGASSASSTTTPAGSVPNTSPLTNLRRRPTTRGGSSGNGTSRADASPSSANPTRLPPTSTAKSTRCTTTRSASPSGSCPTSPVRASTSARRKSSPSGSATPSTNCSPIPLTPRSIRPPRPLREAIPTATVREDSSLSCSGTSLPSLGEPTTSVGRGCAIGPAGHQ
jgi:hypothetical protein